MKLIIKAGATSQLAQIFIADSTKTDGSGLAGLTNASGGLTWYYFLYGASASVSVTLAAGTLGTWSTGGFKEMDATHMPGWYEIGIPNAALASGQSVAMHLQGATNMMPLPIEIQFVSYDPYDAAGLGLSRIDAAITSRMATYTQPTGFLAATFPTGTVANTTNITAGTVTTATNVTNVSAGGITTASFAAVAEAYTTKGTGASYNPVSLLWDIHQRLYSFTTVSTDIHVKKIDNSTDAHVLAMDSATDPTSSSWSS